MMMGFHEYLTRKRLAQAVYELNNSDKTVLEIAVNAGFPDAKGLYAAFQQYFGMTPNDYRRKIGIHMDANAKIMFLYASRFRILLCKGSWRSIARKGKPPKR